MMAEGMLKKAFDLAVRTNGTWCALPIRLALGVTFLAHGSQKLFGAFGGPGLAKLTEMFGASFHPAWLWATLAASGEFFGGLLVLIGLVTRFGALNIAIVMAVAIIKVHWGHFFADKRGMEYPLMCFAGALALLITGGGVLSLDQILSRRRGP